MNLSKKTLSDIDTKLNELLTSFVNVELVDGVISIDCNSSSYGTLVFVIPFFVNKIKCEIRVFKGCPDISLEKLNLIKEIISTELAKIP